MSSRTSAETRLRRSLLAVLGSSLLVLLAFPGRAEPPALFKDPEDGAVDLSGWLGSRTGFLPVVAPITEPAVGFGGAVALVKFHGGGLASAATAPPGPTGKPIPPDVSAAGGALTENGTWAAFVGHLGYWGGDRWRYVGALARISPVLDVYGRDGRAYGFNLDGWAVYQELMRRVGKTDLFAGVRFAYVDSTVAFPFDAAPPEVPRPSFQSIDSGLGVVVEYDTRDNTFSPATGVNLEGSGMFLGPWLGGDAAYQRYSLITKGFWDVHPRLVLAARVQVLGVGGDPPFYARPFVRLRGIPSMRYQGDAVVAVDGEVRWNAWKRWWLVGFAGAGWTSAKSGSLASEESVHAGGAGFRYLVARRLGLQAGIDVAKGPEQSAIYVVVGSSF